MRAYKGFDKDFQCRGYQYAVGETYTHDGEIEICDSGFHFAKDLVLCFEFYPYDKSNRYAEIEIESTPIWDEVGHKGVASVIKVVREMPYAEIDALLDNNRNSGYSNSGHRNSGHRNSGDWNSGHSNSGYSNSGDWNATTRETGSFNTKQSKNIRVFNKKCKRKTWDNASKPNFLYFEIGKGQAYKEAFIASWESADKIDRETVKDLPNFDADVFFEISGIRIKG